MNHRQKISIRILALLVSVWMLMSFFPALAESAATPTDLLPVQEETEENQETPQEEPEEIPSEEDDGETQEKGLRLAELSAGTMLWADEKLQQEQDILAEKSVVLVLSAGEKAARIAYVFEEADGKPAAANAFVRIRDLRLMTEAEQAEWQAASHPVSKEVCGFILEPVILQVSEEEEADPTVPETTEEAEEPEEPKEPEEPEEPEKPEKLEETEEPKAQEKPAETDQVPATETDLSASLTGEEDVVPDETLPSSEIDNQAKTEGTPAGTEEEHPDAAQESGEATAAEGSLQEQQTDEVRSSGHLTLPSDLEEAVDLEEELRRLEQEEEGAASSATEDPVVFTMANGTLSASYSAKYENTNLPATRDQGIWGSCWAFSAIGGMEIDLIQSSLATTAVDLSELFLVYFSSHNYPYAKEGGEGDDLAPIGEGSYLELGGNSQIAYRILANLIGTVNESDAPYDAKQEPEIPSAYTAISAQITGAYLISPSDRDGVKQAILDHGAVGASINKSHTYNEANNCMYGAGTTADHDILLVGWDDNFPKSNFTVQPSGNGAWKVRNSWGGLQDYFWVSYYDGALLNSDTTAYSASNEDVSDFCYSFDKTPYPGKYYYKTDKAVVRQSFTLDGQEKLQAVGVETGADKMKVTVSVQVGGSEVASGSVTANYKGFYRVPLNTAYSISDRTEVELVVTYQAQVSGSRVYIPYEVVGSEKLPSETGSYQYTADSGSGGFDIDGLHVNGDARLKLYTKKTGTSSTEPKTIALSETQLSGLKSGDEKKLTATISPAAAAGATLTWYSSDTGAARVEQDGTVIGGARGGTAMITAMASNGVYASCRVTVTPAYVAVKGVQIQGFDGAKSYTINDSTAHGFSLGDTLRIEAELTPRYPTDYTITWKSTNTDVLTVEDAVNNGCDVKAWQNGTAQIRVTVTDSKGNKSYEDYIQLIIDLRTHVTSVSLDADSLSLWEGEGWQLTATVYPEDADNQNLIWSSSDASVASVTGAGYVQGMKDGTAVITVKTEDGGFTDSCTVTVSTKDLIGAFVYRMYRVCLLREPDPNGFADWVNQLRTGNKTGAEVAGGFYNSREMKERGLTNEQFVIRAYEGILGRKPDAAGLADWKDRLEKGVSYQYIVAGFTNSREFSELCEKYGIERGQYKSKANRDQNLGITSYVSRLYTQMLGRTYDENGLNDWCGRILADPTKEKALNVATSGFMHSQEFLNKDLSDTEFVKILYRTFLGREYDAPGLEDWVNRLANGKTRDEVAHGFAYSREFGEIMAEYGLN